MNNRPVEKNVSALKRKLDAVDDLPSPLPNKKAKTDEVVAPSYVVNMPIKVDSDVEDETTDGAEVNHSFPTEYFAAPFAHFRLHPADEGTVRRGKVREAEYASSVNEKASGQHAEVNKLNQIATLFTDESFAEKNEESRIEAEKRLSLSIGLNKMASLSETRNRALTNMLQAPIQSIMPVKRFAMMWDGAWQEKINDKWMDASYQRVRDFYRQLKRIDKKLAKQFRSQVEQKRGHMVPYREIREKIKNHTNTKTLVKEAREKNPRAPVYLGFFDPDTKKLRAGQVGSFSVFDQEVKKNPELVIASVGYMIEDPTNPLLELGVLFDLSVRDMTARYIKNGVYYPEPCTIVRVPEDSDTVPEHFVKKGARHYRSPKEMPILIKSVLEERKLNAQRVMAFNMDGAIVTAKPARMQREFTAMKNMNNKIILWRLEDFSTMRSISQTHAMSRDWALYIVDAVQLTEYDGFNRSDIKNILTSLISRVYKAFDPIEIAQRLQRSQSFPVPFQQCLIKVIDLYDKDEFLQRTVALDKNESGVGTRTRHERYWQRIDNITSFAALMKEITFHLTNQRCDITVGHIVNAAYWSNAAVASVMRARLCLNFEMLCREVLNQYFEEHAEVAEYYDGPENDELTPVDQAILNNTILNDKKASIKLLKQMNSLTRSRYNTTPLHWAAMTGNKEVIKWLISKKNDSTIGWAGDITQKADFDILPLHCAILYCAYNGVDLELIKLVTDSNIVSQQTQWLQSTPLLLAIKQITNPAKVVRFLCENDANVDGEDQDYDDNETYPIIAAVAKNDEETVRVLLEHEPCLLGITDEDERPLLFVARDEASMTIFKLLVQAGADVNERDEREDTTLLLDAISPLLGARGGDEELIDYLLANGANVHDEDEDDNTPLSLALFNGDNNLINKLIAAGVNTDTTEMTREETEALREATGEDYYTPDEEESMEKHEKQKAVRWMMRNFSDYVSYPKTENEFEKNELIQMTFDPSPECDISSDLSSDDSSVDSDAVLRLFK